MFPHIWKSESLPCLLMVTSLFQERSRLLKSAFIKLTELPFGKQNALLHFAWHGHKAQCPIVVLWVGCSWSCFQCLLLPGTVLKHLFQYTVKDAQFPLEALLSTLPGCHAPQVDTAMRNGRPGSRFVFDGQGARDGRPACQLPFQQTPFRQGICFL